jgi:hypothetical protein
MKTYAEVLEALKKRTTKIRPYAYRDLTQQDRKREDRRKPLMVQEDA